MRKISEVVAGGRENLPMERVIILECTPEEWNSIRVLARKNFDHFYDPNDGESFDFLRATNSYRRLLEHATSLRFILDRIEADEKKLAERAGAEIK